jgi:hypothetical protein
LITRRNPNEPLEPDAVILHGGRTERNRFRNIEWPPYEAVHKKYLGIGKINALSLECLCLCVAVCPCLLHAP